jgi:hypothetical protein
MRITDLGARARFVALLLVVAIGSHFPRRVAAVS